MAQATQFPANAILKALDDKFHADPGFTFVSRKNRRNLPVWAPRDHTFCGFAEHTDRILSFEDRPEILGLTYRGGQVIYVVDFRVYTARSTILVGLSLLGKPGHADETHLHDLAKAHCARRGQEFVHVSDNDLVRLAARMPCAAAA